jgi:hypothetical protein
MTALLVLVLLGWQELNGIEATRRCCLSWLAVPRLFTRIWKGCWTYRTRNLTDARSRNT